jgi:hypothetical protein
MFLELELTSFCDWISVLLIHQNPISEDVGLRLWNYFRLCRCNGRVSHGLSKLEIVLATG